MAIIRAIQMAGVVSLLSLNAAPIQAPFEQIWSGKFGALENHPGHYPFISCWTFRSICDHLIDHTREFDPDVVQRGDIIYLNCWYLPWFATYIHDKIKHPYILVTCDTNTWLPYPSLKTLIHDKKCAAWFGRNMLFSDHPKLFQIPMGQDLAFFDPGFETKHILEARIALPKEKKHLLYMNFFARSAADRRKIVDLFENAPYCFSRNKAGQEWTILNRKDFYEEISSSQYTLSPWGVEFECLRTWEALVLGSIPIVEHSFLDPMYRDLPILLIHKWEEIDEPMLKTNYEKLKKKSTEKAYFDYWESLIKEVQFHVRYADFPLKEAPVLNCEELAPFLDPTLPLFYHGSLTLSRPLQLAKVVPQIFLFDRWFDESLQEKINCEIQTEESFKGHLATYRPCQIFLDLTHQRSSLLKSDEVLTKDWELIRHSLKEDLYALFDQLKIGSRLIGNKISDEYVSEVLDQISQEQKWQIERNGDFWLLCKTVKNLLPEWSEATHAGNNVEIENSLALFHLEQLLSAQCEKARALVVIKSSDLLLDSIYIKDSPSIDADLRQWVPFLSPKGTLAGEKWSKVQGEIGRFAQENRLKVTYKGESWRLINIQ